MSKPLPQGCWFQCLNRRGGNLDFNEMLHNGMVGMFQCLNRRGGNLDLTPCVDRREEKRFNASIGVGEI